MQDTWGQAEQILQGGIERARLAMSSGGNTSSDGSGALADALALSAVLAELHMCQLNWRGAVNCVETVAGLATASAGSKRNVQTAEPGSEDCVRTHNARAQLASIGAMACLANVRCSSCRIHLANSRLSCCS